MQRRDRCSGGDSASESGEGAQAASSPPLFYVKPVLYELADSSQSFSTVQQLIEKMDQKVSMDHFFERSNWFRQQARDDSD